MRHRARQQTQAACQGRSCCHEANNVQSALPTTTRSYITQWTEMNGNLTHPGIQNRANDQKHSLVEGLSIQLQRRERGVAACAATAGLLRVLGMWGTAINKNGQQKEPAGAVVTCLCRRRISGCLRSDNKHK